MENTNILQAKILHLLDDFTRINQIVSHIAELSVPEWKSINDLYIDIQSLDLMDPAFIFSELQVDMGAKDFSAIVRLLKKEIKYYYAWYEGVEQKINRWESNDYIMHLASDFVAKDFSNYINQMNQQNDRIAKEIALLKELQAFVKEKSQYGVLEIRTMEDQAIYKSLVDGYVASFGKPFDIERIDDEYNALQEDKRVTDEQLVSTFYLKDDKIDEMFDNMAQCIITKLYRLSRAYKIYFDNNGKVTGSASFRSFKECFSDEEMYLKVDAVLKHEKALQVKDLSALCKTLMYRKMLDSSMKNQTILADIIIAEYPHLFPSRDVKGSSIRKYSMVDTEVWEEKFHI